VKTCGSQGKRWHCFTHITITSLGHPIRVVSDLTLLLAATTDEADGAGGTASTGLVFDGHGCDEGETCGDGPFTIWLFNIAMENHNFY